MSLRDAMDRLFEESFVRPRGALSPMGLSELALDVYETENDVVINAAIPGIKPEDIDIAITGDTVSIKGELKQETKVEKANYYRQERRYGAFSRAVSLPVPISADKAEATFKDGVLTLTIPKAEEAKPKTIKIKTNK
jgi:HSP20 family protein